MNNTGKQKMSAPELRRLLAEHLTRQKLGLYWERDAIEHDKALNANVVLPRLVPELSHTPEGCTKHRNLIIEGCSGQVKVDRSFEWFAAICRFSNSLGGRYPKLECSLLLL